MSNNFSFLDMFTHVYTCLKEKEYSQQADQQS